jgi:cytoskeletal protein CcmA (bactofilin family)
MVALLLHENRPDDRDIGLVSHGHTGGNGEVDMLNSFKSKAAEQDKSVAASAAEVMEQTEHSVVGTVAPKPARTTKPGPDSCIGSGMSVIGKIECDGPAQVFGRIEGELRASDLVVGDGAQIEGNVIAQNVTVCGRVKGTIHAVRVKLQSGGAVEGDIFHKSLSIDENSLFEGSSRRVENAMDPASTPSIGADDLRRVESARAEWSESMVRTKQ